MSIASPASKIVLDHVEPAIWRRVEVPLTTSLRGLHEVIQAVMLFENYHLFDFTVEMDGQSRRYGIPDPDGWIKLSDAKNTKLGPLTDRGLKRFAYTYTSATTGSTRSRSRPSVMPIPASNTRALSTAPAALRRKTSAESPASRSSSRPWQSPNIPSASA